MLTEYDLPLLIIVFLNSIFQIIFNKYHNASINRGFKRMESGLKQGPNDQLAQNIYPLAPIIDNREPGCSLPSRASEEDLKRNIGKNENKAGNFEPGNEKLYILCVRRGDSGLPPFQNFQHVVFRDENPREAGWRGHYGSEINKETEEEETKEREETSAKYYK